MINAPMLKLPSVYINSPHINIINQSVKFIYLNCKIKNKEFTISQKFFWTYDLWYM